MLAAANEDERAIHPSGQALENGEVWIDLIDGDDETLFDQSPVADLGLIHAEMPARPDTGITMTDLTDPIVLLLVDDDDIVRSALTVALSSLGFVVLPAANGQVALQFAETAPPNVVITDLSMPVMNGYQLCVALRTDARLMAIPITVISSSLPSESLAVPPHNRFLQKPVDVAVLAASVIALFARGKVGGAAASVTP